MTRPLRVGFVVHVMQVAGAEVLVRETVRRLAGRVTRRSSASTRSGRIGEEMKADGVDVVAFGRAPGLDWGVARRMAAAVRERGIEVMHAHQYTPFFYAALAKAAVPAADARHLHRARPPLPGWRLDKPSRRQPAGPLPPRRRGDRVLRVQRQGAD